MLLYTELTAKADLSFFPFFITALKDGAKSISKFDDFISLSFNSFLHHALA